MPNGSRGLSARQAVRLFESGVRTFGSSYADTRDDGTRALVAGRARTRSVAPPIFFRVGSPLAACQLAGVPLTSLTLMPQARAASPGSLPVATRWPPRRRRRGSPVSFFTRPGGSWSACGPLAAGTRPRPKQWPWPGRSRPIEPRPSPVALYSTRNTQTRPGGPQQRITHQAGRGESDSPKGLRRSSASSGTGPAAARARPPLLRPNSGPRD